MNFHKFNLLLYTQYIYFPLLMILNILFFVMCITRNSDEIKKMSSACGNFSVIHPGWMPVKR
ncbi:hypothetical protein FEL34_05295 [Escherichia coli]|nr:hypothetical protein [Escherichia coli]